MPLSMRRQTLNRKKQDKKRLVLKENRKEALRLIIEDKDSVRSIASASGVPKSTVALLQKRYKENDQDGLMQMTETPNQRGVSTVLTSQEELMTCERIKVAATRGFAIDVTGLRAVMGRIAADGRKGWKNGIPSYDTIRSFRARHRDITCRKAESKEHAKLKAENYAHVETFFDALQQVQNLHPGILINPNVIWNMDETAVDANEGDSTKVLSGADSHHGGFRGSSTAYGICKHITAVVAVSASGLIAPPFFIIAGKKLSQRWWAPVKGTLKNGHCVAGICSRFTKPNWFPHTGVIKLTENGSMEMPTMCAVVKHINNFVRHFVKDEYYLLCLDGHSSRKGAEWVEECRDNRCEAVVSPANTSHFLQACDQTVNKRFKAALREIRDEFCKLGTYDTKQVNFNLACAIYAYEQITATDIVNSFRVTGVFPFDRDFPKRFQTEVERTAAKAEEEKNRIESSGPASRLQSVVLRKSDSETMKEVLQVFNTKAEASRKIQQISILLKQRETTNAILMAAGFGRGNVEDDVVEPRKRRELHSSTLELQQSG